MTTSSTAKMKEVKIVVRDLRKEISEDLMEKYEKEFFALRKMEKIKREKDDVKKEVEEDFMFVYEKKSKMPKPKAMKREVTQKVLRKPWNPTPFSDHQCEICQQYFTGKRSLKDHVERHYQQTSFECEKCQKKFSKRSGLKLHICIENLTCTFCSYFSNNFSNVKRHMRAIHNVQDEISDDGFVCDYCGIRFKRKRYLPDHFRKHLNKPAIQNLFSCDLCSKQFKDLSGMREHVLIHAVHKVDCKVCKRKMRPSNLREHLRYVHIKSEKKFECHICHQKLKTPTTLRDHLGRHGNEFQCSICSKKFSNLRQLNEHMKLHQNPEEFQCKICGNQMQSKSTLRKHLKVHDMNRKKPFECSRCDFKTDCQRSLKSHKKIHERLDMKLKNNPGAVKCKECPRVLLNAACYKHHLKFQHGNRPKYQCDICGTETKRKHDIEYHLRNKHFKKKL